MSGRMENVDLIFRQINKIRSQKITHTCFPPSHEEFHRITHNHTITNAHLAFLAHIPLHVTLTHFTPTRKFPPPSSLHLFCRLRTIREPLQPPSPRFHARPPNFGPFKLPASLALFSQAVTSAKARKHKVSGPKQWEAFTQKEGEETREKFEKPRNLENPDTKTKTQNHTLTFTSRIDTYLNNC